MASTKEECKGDVHVPQCFSPDCSRNLARLTKELRSKGLKCVSEYSLNGKYVSKFKWAFEGCYFTMIHQCLILWDKIKSCEGALSEADKIFCINFNPEVIQFESPSTAFYRSRSDFRIFFEEFTISSIFDDESLEDFVPKVRDSVEKKQLQLSEAVKVSETIYKQMVHESDKDPFPLECLESEVISDDQQQISDELVDSFVKHPYIFGQGVQDHQQTFVRSRFTKYTEQQELSFGISESDDPFKLKEKLDGLHMNMPKESFMTKMKYLMYELLPTMYKNRNWIHLSSVVASSQTVLQEKAITFLELMFLQEQDPDNIPSFTTLNEMVIIFHGTLSELGKLISRSDTTITVNLGRLSSLYLLLLSHTIMMEKTKSEMRKCDELFETIRLTSLGVATDDLKFLDSFLDDVVSTKCNNIKNIVCEYFELKKSSSFRIDFAKDHPSIQVIAVFQCLRQLFRNQDIQDLEHYVNPPKPNKSLKVFGSMFKSKDTQFYVHNAVTILLMRGLARFFHSGFSLVSDEDVNSLCMKCISIMSEAAKKDLPEEVKNLLPGLVCDSKFTVRSIVFNQLSRASHLRENLIRALTDKIQALLSPLMKVDKLKKVTQTDDFHNTPQWATMNAQFDNKPVLVFINIPGRKEIREEFQMDLPMVEMKVLQKLQHVSIIQMLAYQDTCIPAFYIVEDYQRTNLQIVLKNCKDNGNFIPQPDRYRCLLDVLSGLEYCHEKGYIHRNLTASSVLIIERNPVSEERCAKLCGFHLACQLKPGHDKFIDKSNPDIPTLWSAPESLHIHEYSKESDVWMVGHLMYEVLTHGVMPYSHQKETDPELVSMIIRREIKLVRQPCIDKAAFKIIQDCASSPSLNRPSVTDIKTQLTGCYNAVKTSSQDARNALVFCTGRQSVGYGKGTQKTADHVYDHHQNVTGPRKDTRCLSDMIIRHTIQEEYIFTEKNVTEWSSEELNLIRSRVLEGILPTFKVLQNLGVAQQVEIHIPSSCLGDLKAILEQKLLGSSLKLYLYCVYKVAVLLESLHKLSWALGAMNISLLYIQLLPSDVKVHVVSLSYLNYLGQEEQLPEKITTPDDEGVLARAAPEVYHSGLYSKASDVYCFGHLLVDILEVFTHGQQGTKQSAQQAERTPETSAIGVAKTDSKMLKSLIKSCRNERESDRPSSSQLVSDLHKILEEDFKLKIPCDEEEGVNDNNYSTVASLCSSLSQKEDRS